MRSISLVLLATLLVLGATAARTDDERRARWNRTDPDLGQAVIEGVATAQFLWLRGSWQGADRAASCRPDLIEHLRRQRRLLLLQEPAVVRRHGRRRVLDGVARLLV